MNVFHRIMLYFYCVYTCIMSYFVHSLIPIVEVIHKNGSCKLAGIQSSLAYLQLSEWSHRSSQQLFTKRMRDRTREK